MKNLFDAAEKRKEAAIERLENELRQLDSRLGERMDRLQELNAASADKRFQILHPIKARAQRKESQTLREEISTIQQERERLQQRLHTTENRTFSAPPHRKIGVYATACAAGVLLLIGALAFPQRTDSTAPVPDTAPVSESTLPERTQPNNTTSDATAPASAAQQITEATYSDPSVPTVDIPLSDTKEDALSAENTPEPAVSVSEKGTTDVTSQAVPDNETVYTSVPEEVPSTPIDTAPIYEPPKVSSPVHNTNRTVSLPSGSMVWISATGEKFHRINDCGRMNPQKAYQMTVDDAVANGYDACEKCY